MHLLLAVMKSWWLTTWKRKNISRVTREKIHITLNHFCIIFIFLYIIWVRFIYLNMFKIGIIWFAITKYVFSFPLSQIIFLLLTLITIIQFSIILTLISSSHTISKSILQLLGVCLSTSIYHRSFHLFDEVGWDCLRLGLILPNEYGAVLQLFFLLVNLLVLLLCSKSVVFGLYTFLVVIVAQGIFLFVAISQ